MESNLVCNHTLNLLQLTKSDNCEVGILFANHEYDTNRIGIYKVLLLINQNCDKIQERN